MHTSTNIMITIIYYAHVVTETLEDCPASVGMASGASKSTNDVPGHTLATSVLSTATEPNKQDGGVNITLRLLVNFFNSDTLISLQMRRCRHMITMNVTNTS